MIKEFKVGNKLTILNSEYEIVYVNPAPMDGVVIRCCSTHTLSVFNADYLRRYALPLCKFNVGQVWKRESDKDDGIEWTIIAIDNRFNRPVFAARDGGPSTYSRTFNVDGVVGDEPSVFDLTILVRDV